MRGALMRLWTREQHVAMLSKFPSDVDAAKEYSKVKPVTPQNVQYWRKIFVEQDGNMARADAMLKAGRQIRKPTPDEDIGDDLPDLNKVYKCVLVISDQHYPYQHPDIIRFLSAIKDKFPIDLVLNTGDEVDYHALSFHDSDPNLDSAGPELERARKRIAKLHDLFPQQLVAGSNHGSMVFRRAKAHGIPVQVLRPYRQVLFPDHGAPGWSWADEWIIKTPGGPVLLRHSSSNPLHDAAHNRANIVVGHAHSVYSIDYAASSDCLYWGMTVGCLIDKNSYAFAYGKNTQKKPIIGVGMILDGLPHLIPMRLNSRGRWVGKL